MLFDFFLRSKTPEPMPFATDMHCHVIPEVDDGSPDLTTSLELLEQMSALGLRRIFASPHATKDRYENTPESIAGPFAALKDAARSKHLPVELHHHFEYRIDDFFLNLLENNNLVTLPGKFILIENPFANEPWGLESIIHELLNLDFNPILAHPERYAYYALRHRDRYKRLHDIGVYFQVNMLSLAGYYGKSERSTALYLLKEGLVQFVGTDIHREAHMKSISNYLCSRTYRREQKLFDQLRNDTL